MDDEQTFDEMKASYQEHIDQIIDFNEDDYGYGPMVFFRRLPCYSRSRKRR